MGPVAMLFEHVCGFLAETKPDENVILQFGAITSNSAIYVYWVMPLHFCPRRDASLSLPKSIPWDLYHLILPRSSFCKLAKVCLGKDSKQGSRPDLRQQRPYFQLLLWSRIRDLFCFFETAPPPSIDEGISEVVPVKGFQMLATSASFGVQGKASRGALQQVPPATQ